MLNDFTVNLVIKDKNMRSVSERTYTLQTYCQDLKYNLTRVINDVEDAFCKIQNVKSKDQWSDETVELFQRIRHSLLNNANNIERLPKNARYKGKPSDSVNSAEFLADLINTMTSKK